jgi:large subunit ribosomal protein L15
VFLSNMVQTDLPKLVKKKSKRRGKGYGSGRGGHTAGRGQKGQKARNKIGVLFEGVKTKKSLLKRLPLRRGKGKLKAKNKPIVVKIGLLNLLPSGAKVNVATLAKHGIINKEDAVKFGVKILGNGNLDRKLTVELPISKSAAKKIEKAGGKVTKDV